MNINLGSLSKPLRLLVEVRALVFYEDTLKSRQKAVGVPLDDQIKKVAAARKDKFLALPEKEQEAVDMFVSGCMHIPAWQDWKTNHLAKFPADTEVLALIEKSDGRHPGWTFTDYWIAVAKGIVGSV